MNSQYDSIGRVTLQQLSILLRAIMLRSVLSAGLFDFVVVSDLVAGINMAQEKMESGLSSNSRATT